MRVLGIDPGLRNLGWGVIDVSGARLTHVANGICHSDGATDANEASGGTDRIQFELGTISRNDLDLATGNEIGITADKGARLVA